MQTAQGSPTPISSETGYRIGVWQPAEAAVTPFMCLQGSTNTQQAFSEPSERRDQFRLAQKARDATKLGWQHEYADVARPVTAAFAGAPLIGFTVYGAESSRDSAVTDGFRAYLRYDGDVSVTANNHMVSAGLRMI